MKALIVKEDSLIYAAEVPEEPKKWDYEAGGNEQGAYVHPEYYDVLEIYEAALASAKESAVLVSDQDAARYLIRASQHGRIVRTIKPGGIYPIPDLQWEVRTLSKGGWHEKDGIHFNEYDVAVLTLTNESDMARYEANLYAEVNTETKIGFDIAAKAYYDGFRKAVAILKESIHS